MKKLFLLLVLLVSTIGFAQKGKGKSATKNVVLTTVDNISAEIISEKTGKRVVLFVKKEGKVDTLEVKKLDKVDFKPTSFTVKSFTTQGKKFYHVNWKEEIKVDTKLKKENGFVAEDQIWDTETKTLLLGNVHKSSHIKETIFLDANKTASHDVEKNRSEGFEFTLNPDGSFVLKTKTQNSTYVYNTASSKYEMKGSPKSTGAKKKK
ncbi:hypothetical protein [Flavobacterium proteolyticum]|uniref:DUF4968 domain-containing protein n=1 Tax=Flavobacterium proteolyticum TaxID=2911683 RepID=A0ABR9WUG4_9FLAO|nr:hypothetical protein [Flavobacterium proteolyticum]MBE9577296.1 hypothetical protein [Flavobacterium proteolyticum]